MIYLLLTILFSLSLAWRLVKCHVHGLNICSHRRILLINPYNDSLDFSLRPNAPRTALIHLRGVGVQKANYSIGLLKS